MLTEELNRRGLAYVWGLMGLPGSLTRIMIDSGNLVGDVVSEDFARQANLAGEACRNRCRREQDADNWEVLPGPAKDSWDWDFIRRPAVDRVGDEERSQPGAAVPEPE